MTNIKKYKFTSTINFNGSMYYEKMIKTAADVSGVNVDVKNLGFDKWKPSETDVRFKVKVNGTEEEIDKFKSQIKSIGHKIK